MIEQLVETCTILLVRRGTGDPQRLAFLVGSSECEDRVCLWVNDQRGIIGMAESGFTAVVAIHGDARQVRRALTGYSLMESPAIGRTFRTAGSTAAGVSMIALMEAKDGLDRADFISAWREHVPLALALHHGALRYVQYELLEGGRSAFPFAGMADLHFPSREAVEPGLYREPGDVELIQEDTARLLSSADVFIGSQYDFAPSPPRTI